MPVSESVARRAGSLGRRWRTSHPGIGVADLAIAATAEEMSAGLATRNLWHFPMFEGRRAPYPLVLDDESQPGGWPNLGLNGR